MTWKDLFKLKAEVEAGEIRLIFRLLGLDFAGILAVRPQDWSMLHVMFMPLEMRFFINCWFLALFVGRDNSLYD